LFIIFKGVYYCVKNIVYPDVVLTMRTCVF